MTTLCPICYSQGWELYPFILPPPLLFARPWLQDAKFVHPRLRVGREASISTGCGSDRKKMDQDPIR